MELQLDYWTQGSTGGATNKDKDRETRDKETEKEKSKKQDSNSKSSIRTTFRSLAIVHLSTSPLLPQVKGLNSTVHVVSVKPT